jgi:hypothetical protein
MLWVEKMLESMTESGEASSGDNDHSLTASGLVATMGGLFWPAICQQGKTNAV